MPKSSFAHVYTCHDYDITTILALMPNDIFEVIVPGNAIIIKPNWVMESHKTRPNEWEYVITHPSIVTAVLRKVLERLGGQGRVAIIDGPMTEASFDKLIDHYPVQLWRQLAIDSGVSLEIVDLRDHEWLTKNDVTVERKVLPGDPKGKVLVELVDSTSEFWGHRRSKRGYYGADYDRTETNCAHDGHRNLYSVSRTVLEGDVFINLPKLKTHRKAGITCCLKNLVGINTYKNFLPHHSEGGAAEGGDQFPGSNLNARVEGSLVGLLKQHVLKNDKIARFLTPLNPIGKKIFGDSSKVVRNGSWYGNDTLWRTILDLNKVLMYANVDGTMKTGEPVQAKHYIGIVDAVMAGEGEGPLSPEPVMMGRIICGTNPVAIDAVCASLMGFDPLKIPSIAKAFEVQEFPLCDFNLDEVRAIFDGEAFAVHDLPDEAIVDFEPALGWKQNIENTKSHAS